MYSPSNNFTDSIMRMVQLKFQIETNGIRSFATEEKLLEAYAKIKDGDIYVVTFNGNDPKTLDYNIRIHDKYQQWHTDKLFRDTQAFGMSDSGHGASERYFYRGFLSLQMAIDSSFIELSKNIDKLPFSISMQEFPYPPHTVDSGLTDMFMHFLPLITIFSFIFLCPALIKRVAEERSSGIKEFMKMVGMKSWVQWFGWFLHALSTNILSIAIIVFFMKVSLWGTPYPPIEFCDASVFFVFLLLYCIAAIAFCFFISTLFNRPSIAMIFGILIWILTYFIPKAFISKYQNVSWGKKVLFGVFPNMALNYGYTAISVYEMREIGVNWTNLSKSGSGGIDDITMQNVFFMFLFDTIFFTLLAFYIENINPGEYGIKKSFYFPITELWRFIKKLICKTPSQIEHETIKLNNVEEGRGQKVGIDINKLYKKYGSNVAVEGLSMQIYDNQITVLLGHNGAGKTTTMSMITGMTEATCGTIKINGFNIKNNIDKVRKSMGLCPQHNLFFLDFTVMEHLIFFSMLKGRSYSEAKKEVIEILQKLDLIDKKDEKPTKLSGGMKRKLCLGMAIVGDSRVLILDEPTSGMDPESRREVWNLLLEWRKTKTILITTHFMEEAEVLGDWIAIMANGKLQCYGTSMFLKRQYATGYHLSLILDNFEHRKEIDDLIVNTIEGAESLRENGNNIVYVLPFEQMNKFSNLFQKLDEKIDDFNINNLSITLTTLEEVFLKAKSEQNDLPIQPDLRRLKSENVHQTRSYFLPSPLTFKRYYFLMRKYLLYLPAIFLTILLTLLTIHLGQDSSEAGIEPDLNLKLGIYGETTVFYGGTPLINDQFKQVKNSYGNLLENQALTHEVPSVSDAIIEKGMENIAFYLKHMIVAAEFNETDGEMIINAMYSSKALHGSPISLNLIMNSITKVLLGNDYSITTRNKPMVPINDGNISPNEQSEVQVGILWLVLVPLGMLFLLSNFIIFPVSEISTNFTYLQIMCGIPPAIYWLSNFLFDFVLYLIIIFLKFLILIIITSVAYNDGTPFGFVEITILVFAIWLPFGVVGIPFSYIFSHRKTVAGGIALLLMIGIFLSIVPTVVVVVLEMSGDQYYENIGHTLKNIFLVFSPNFALTYISVKFARKAVRNYNWLIMPTEKRKLKCHAEEDINPCCRGDTIECSIYKNYFTNKELGIGKDIPIMLLGFFIYFSLIIFLHSYTFKQVKEKFFEVIRKIRGSFYNLHDDDEKDDPDDVEEQTGSLNARDVKKYRLFKKVVDKVSFNVKYGECYGLLGVNGAGKTTTFRTLTRDLVLNKGKVSIRDREENKTIPITNTKYLKKIGYCPQYDALNLNLTGRELLKVFAMFRGYVVTKEVDQVVNTFIDIFDLKKYADKPCSSYSGGNKRKLSLALAFIGFPQNVLLDEPTSGVDPASRRSFWNTLSYIQKNENVACVLSSHSMEECEALCHRIGIMKDGKIKAEGTLPYLKDKYQKGLNVIFKLKSEAKYRDQIIDSVTDVDETKKEEEADYGEDVVDGLGPSVEPEKPQRTIQQLKNRFQEIFKDSQLKDEHSGMLYYHVKDVNDRNKRLSSIFKEIEELKNEFKEIIEDYSISETSLEDVFLRVARETS